MTKLSVVLASAGFALAAAQAGPAFAAPVPAATTSSPTAAAIPSGVTAGEQSELAVAGRGSVQAVPDVMRLSAGVEVRRATAAEAFALVRTTAAKLDAALIAAGVARADLRTNDLSLGVEYDKYPKVVGYRASQGVEALVRDLSRADAVVDAVAAVGEDVRLNSVSFEASRSQALVKQARAAAYRDALAKAEQYAALTGRRLGRVVKLEEEGDSSPSRFAMAEKASVNPGQATVSVVVRVVYELS